MRWCCMGKKKAENETVFTHGVLRGIYYFPWHEAVCAAAAGVHGSSCFGAQQTQEFVT